jgi:hypothetical protein
VEVSNPDPLADCPPSKLPPNVATEPAVAVNPANPNNIVAIWIDHGDAGLAAGATLDGGQTWHNVAIPGITQCTGGTWLRGFDPWLGFAPNGDLYSVCIGKSTFKEGQMFVNKSTDGGLTWGNPTPLYVPDNSNSAFDDKPSITADPTNANDVYATWARFKQFPNGNNAETMLARSTDGGQTWQPAQDIHDAQGSNFVWGQQIVVLPDGTLIDAFCEGDFSNSHQAALTLLRSTDRGQSWSAPIHAVVQQPIMEGENGPNTPLALVTDPDTGQLVSAVPMFDSVAVDHNTGALYAVWIDGRFSNFQYNAIALSTSTDGGFTWSQPVQANQTPSGVLPVDRQAWNPTVAVADDGTVGVTYYDFRNNTPASGALTDYWLAYCHPSATTPVTSPSNWSEVRLTDTSFDLEQAPGNWLGDYEGLAVAGKNFAAVWGMPDGSTTNQESIFFRRAISGGSRTAPSVVRTDAAMPVNQLSQPALGDRLTAALGNAVATRAEHGAIPPGQAAFEIRFAAGIGPSQFADWLPSEGQPAVPPIRVDLVGGAGPQPSPATTAGPVYAAADHHAVDRLFADVDNNPVADVFADHWALTPGRLSRRPRLR